MIILNGAADVGEFWKKLKQPDLILMRPGSTGPANAANPATAPKSHAVSSVKVRGRVDDDMIFYLRSRGIRREEAVRLIVEGFFANVYDRITLEPVRETLRQAVAEKLEL